MWCFVHCAALKCRQTCILDVSTFVSSILLRVKLAVPCLSSFQFLYFTTCLLNHKRSPLLVLVTVNWAGTGVHWADLSVNTKGKNTRCSTHTERCSGHLHNDTDSLKTRILRYRVFNVNSLLSKCRCARKKGAWPFKKLFSRN